MDRNWCALGLGEGMEEDRCRKEEEKLRKGVVGKKKVGLREFYHRSQGNLKICLRRNRQLRKYGRPARRIFGFGRRVSQTRSPYTTSSSKLNLQLQRPARCHNQMKICESASRPHCGLQLARSLTKKHYAKTRPLPLNSSVL